MTAYPFGSWEPDKPALGATCLEAKNVIPRSVSYGPLNSLSVAIDSALSGECRGAVAVKSATGDVFTYAGTDTGLYALFGGAANDVSRAGGYSGSEYRSWGFIQYADNVIATNGSNKMQKASIGGSFEDLTNAPVARYLCVIKDYVLAGYVNEDGRLTKWSARNNLTGWAAAVDGSGEEVVEESGLITGLVGGDPAFIFCEYAIWRVQWVGGDVVFQYDKIENSHGCIIPGSIITFARRTFYYSSDGFYVFDGATEVPIGDERVDTYFKNDFDSGYPHRVSASIDPINNVVMWLYPGAGNTDGAPNKALIYNYKTNEWAWALFDAQIVFPAYSADTSLEEVSDMFDDIETVTPTLDSPTWRGGDIYLGAFNSSNKLCGFTGPTLEAVLESGEVQLIQDNAVFLSGLRPLVDTTDVTTRVGRRMRTADSVSYTTATAMQDSGRVPVRARGMYHRFEMTIAEGATWTHAQGYAVDSQDITPAGRR